MVQHECATFLDLLQRVPSRRGCTGRLVDPGQQHHRNDRERGGKPEGGRGADPSDQHPTQRRSAGESDRAREFDPRIGRRQLLGRHQRRHQSGRRHAVDDRSAHRDKAGQRQQRQRERVEPDQGQDGEQRHGPQRFRSGHQPAPRDAVGEQARGDREQDERQRQRGLQQSGLAFTDAEHQHRDDRSGGQGDLLGRLGGKIGPSQTVEGRRQLRRFESGHHGILCKLRSAGSVHCRGAPNHPVTDKPQRIPPCYPRCRCK